MAAGQHVIPLVVIVGQTGVGKSALAMQLAKRFKGEVIAADSRTVYKGMDIGTAKPTAEDRQSVIHYGLDVVNPGEKFTASDFKQLANMAISTIDRKGKLPLLVGGTGLYIDALLYDFTFRSQPDPDTRRFLSGMGVMELQQRIVDAGLPMPNNDKNPRHLERILEAGLPPRQPKVLRAHTLVIGLQVAKEELLQRITNRVDAMIAAGLVDEVADLTRTYGNVEALRAPGYIAISEYLNGACSLDDAKRMFIRGDMRLAKRQHTWFKRNENIVWLDSRQPNEEAVRLIESFLNSDRSGFATIKL